MDIMEGEKKNFQYPKSRDSTDGSDLDNKSNNFTTPENH